MRTTQITCDVKGCSTRAKPIDVRMFVETWESERGARSKPKLEKIGLDLCEEHRKTVDDYWSSVVENFPLQTISIYGQITCQEEKA